MASELTTRDLRIKIMKNHIWLHKIASTMNVAPIQVDKWLDDENLDSEIKEAINVALDEILKTWKCGIHAESTERGKLLKPYLIEKYRKQKEKENERSAH